MKRFGALENSDLSTCLSNENKTIVNHLLEKLGQVEEDDSTGKISSAIYLIKSINNLTVPIPKIISAKNARAWVSMDFI